jgi:UDP-N-acetyl-D-galactosamine dehydrogenase
MKTAIKKKDGMVEWVIKDFLTSKQKKEIDLMSIKVTVLGYTFKENCSDIRNTKVKDLIFSMKGLGLDVSLWDPLLSSNDQEELRNNDINVHSNEPQDVQLAFVCVYHIQILEFLKNYKGVVYDYRK